ncbi:MAG: cytochrome c [Fidelibacterota bacterium]|nr:MAG: cytochrome c [Candidatus Neomarinimicrobiota bacterium]
MRQSRDRYLAALRCMWLPVLTGMILVLVGCRGSQSERPPIHLNPNMDNQPKVKAQSESHFFADGQAMRTPPEHTIARGELREDTRLYQGRDTNGEYITRSPLPASSESLNRGRERFGIYCTPCHGDWGDGMGAITRYKYPIPPTSIYDARILAMSAGEVYNVITNGVRNMPSYKAQIPVADRWHIVNYLRELQRNGPPDSTQTMNRATE